jgi:hypothetical protein
MPTTAAMPSTGIRAGALNALYALLGAWFLVVLGVSLAGGFRVALGAPPLPILVAVLVPITLFLAAYYASASVREFVLALDLRILVLLHAWRTVGLGFVFLYFHGKLPGLFALPAGLGDAIAAITAVVLGIALYRGPVAKRWVVAWNGFGLADFVVALGTGVASSQPALAALTGGVTTQPMQAFPLALIPGFFVPLYVITHIIVMLQLRRHWGGAARVDCGPARGR